MATQWDEQSVELAEDEEGRPVLVLALTNGGSLEVFRDGVTYNDGDRQVTFDAIIKMLSDRGAIEA